ncbi:hypothetical protein [Streptomyces sp. NPDC098101]|uniref:hypothetical protein n=1 Tax=Streptomyces sp. NPDC098101 TaxID=3366096 RepID=UPI003815726E
MPRRRPKAVRAERWRPRGHVVVRRIHGVSARTRAAVRRVEEERVRPGAVADALARFAWTFRQPGRYLNASEVRQPGLEVEDARDDLEEVMLHLPLGARRDLGRLVARIDEEFERRTLPNPRPVRVRASDGWWWARTRER